MKRTPEKVVKKRQAALQILIHEFLVRQVALKGPKAALSRNESAFAKHVQMKAPYLSAIKHGHRVIGDKLARQIEVACGKPVGWMDEKHIRPKFSSGLEEQNLIEDLRSAYRENPEIARESILAMKKKLRSTRTGS
jgi:hypothetical protein